jgi:hypothetical protein
MFALIFKIWWMIAILPFIIFIEGSKKFAKFLKERNIYMHWDILHSFVVVLIVILIILWANGF